MLTSPIKRIFLALVALLLPLVVNASIAVGSPIVVVARPGVQAVKPSDLAGQRFELSVKWAPYQNITVKDPGGETVIYAQPQPTESRLFRVPIGEASSFSMGGGFFVDIGPTRWEQGTQRFSMTVDLRKDVDGNSGETGARQSLVLSGLLQPTQEQADSGAEPVQHVFVGEEKFAFYDVKGDLVAEVSLGQLPEFMSIPPPVAMRVAP